MLHYERVRLTLLTLAIRCVHVEGCIVPESRRIS